MLPVYQFHCTSWEKGWLSRGLAPHTRKKNQYSNFRGVRSKFVTDFNSGSGTVVDERTRSVMLAGEHATYELKENIMFAGVHVRSGRRSSELRKARAGSLSLVEDLTMKKSVGLPGAN